MALVLLRLNGKVMGEGLMTLGPDGKTMLLESWLPGKESQKSTRVCIKQ